MSISPNLPEFNSDDADRTLTAGIDDSVIIEVSNRDVAYLESLAEDGKIEFSQDGGREGEESHVVTVSSTDYAGVIGLPDSESIYIEPKISRTALLRLLQLDQTDEDGDVDMLEESAKIKAGDGFIDLLAQLYTDELNSVMRQGITRSYVRVNKQEEYVRGRLDVQKQLQKAGPSATSFHCSHEKLTRDTLLNQAVLYAARILSRLTDEKQLKRQLHNQVQQLRRNISLEPVTSKQVEQVSLSRLSSHYDDLIQLAEMVIKNTLIEDLHAGDVMGYTFLLDMPDTYQDALVSPIEEVRSTYDIETDESLETFLSGDFKLEPKPDYVLSDGKSPVIVLDAKWKDLDAKPKSEDIYQLIAYQQCLDVPGVLVYPNREPGLNREANDTSFMEVDVKNGHKLYAVEIPVIDPKESLDQYRKEIMNSLDVVFRTAL